MNITKLSFATWMLVIAAPCFASQDSVKVVRGQVSDYYIPVVTEYELTGIVTNELFLKPNEHGWELFGMNNDDEVTLKPFTEGAYMTKHDGKKIF